MLFSTMDFSICARTLSVPLELMSDMFLSDCGAYCGACPNLGKIWTCPPFDSEHYIDLSRWRQVSLFALKISPAVDSQQVLSLFRADAAESTLAPFRRRLDELMLDAESANPDSLALFAGSCKLCEIDKCARISGEECKFPNAARTSLEALGFDVSDIADAFLNIKLEWATADSPAPYFCLISAIFSKKELDLKQMAKKVENSFR